MKDASPISKLQADILHSFPGTGGAAEAPADQWRVIADALPALVSYVDPDQRYQFNNRTYEEWFGRSREEIAGKTLREVLGDAAYETLRPHVEAALSGKHVTFEATIPHPNGGSRHVEADYVPHLAADGTVAGFFTLVHDITDRKRREHELAYAFEAAEMAAWDCDHVTGKFAAPARLNLLLGYPKDFPLDVAAVRALHHPEDKDRLEQLRERQVEDRMVTDVEREFRIIRPDGVTRWIFARGELVRGPDGAPVRSLGVAMDITRLKEAEQALRERTEQLEAVLETAPAGVWFSNDREVRWATGNRQAAVMFRTGEDANLSLSAPASERPPIAIYRNGRELASDELPLQRAARGEQVVEEELEFRYPDGDSRTVLLRASTLRDSAGRPAGAVAAAIDISARKQAEDALAEVSDHARALAAERAAVLSQLAEGVIVTDVEGRITFVNKAAECLHGGLKLDVPPHEYAEAFHLFTEDGRPYPPEQLPLARAVLHGETVADARWRIRRPDGTEVLAIGNASPVRGEDGSVIGNVLTLRDDTAREAAERELREADLRKNIALGAGKMGVWDWDIVQDRLVWDAAEFALYGVEPQDFNPTNAGFESFIHPDDLACFRAAAQEALKKRAPLDAEFRIIRADGQERWISERAVTIAGEKGEPIRMVGVSFDITDRKKADERRNLLINELNHRVKNTLATVQSIASQTLKNSDVGPVVREAFESRLISLSKTHDVLTRQNWEGARLSEIAAQSLRPFEDSGDNRISVSGPDVRLSPKAALAISMALHELATNAVKYGALSGEEGSVELEWAVSDRDGGRRLQIRWQESGGPKVEPPRRKGFGSRLIERSLAGELGGRVAIEYLPSGVVCRIEAPLFNIAG